MNRRMQRWIVLGLVAVLLLGAGGAAGLWTYKQNRPDRKWVRLPINPKLPPDQKEEAASQLKEKLLDDKIMTKVADDIHLAEGMKLGSTQEAVALLKQRLFVEVGSVTLPSGETPCLNIGVSGKRKEMDSLGKAPTRILDDVFKILGIKKPADASAPKSF
ncbi:hypothetical protein [Luteolibacter pohnpeiensis]|nr:hypothetical protein [Luteolibacter pohnpeiensis]